MKKGFTLIELLVVVVVIVTLMSITFRIGSIGNEAQARNNTVNRMQRLENCLSGYYAAFGSYPPVPLQGRSRDYHYEATPLGIQKVGRNGSGGKRVDTLVWQNVEAACRAQPIAFEFPFKSAKMADMIRKLSNMAQEKAQSGEGRFSNYRNSPKCQNGFEAFKENVLTDKRGETDWTKVQIFKFGVMSFFTPRYLVCLGCDEDSNILNAYTEHQQWIANNELPCKFENGELYKDWETVNKEVKDEKWKITVLSSQSVCARWLPNLQDSLVGALLEQKNFYGVNVINTGDYDGSGAFGSNPRVYTAGNPQEDGYSQLYMLDMITCVDGWNNELYYYSPAPYQSYRLWSAGANGKTFPPWVSNEEIDSMKTEERKTVQEWVSDDLVHLSS